MNVEKVEVVVGVVGFIAAACLGYLVGASTSKPTTSSSTSPPPRTQWLGKLTAAGENSAVAIWPQLEIGLRFDAAGDGVLVWRQAQTPPVQLKSTPLEK